MKEALFQGFWGKVWLRPQMYCFLHIQFLLIFECCSEPKSLLEMLLVNAEQERKHHGIFFSFFDLMLLIKFLYLTNELIFPQVFAPQVGNFKIPMLYTPYDSQPKSRIWLGHKNPLEHRWHSQIPLKAWVLSEGGSLSASKEFVSAVVTHRRARLLFLLENIMLKCEIHQWCITPISIFSASGHEILARVGGTF